VKRPRRRGAAVLAEYRLDRSTIYTDPVAEALRDDDADPDQIARELGLSASGRMYADRRGYL
jgi:hypothetical protein